MKLLSHILVNGIANHVLEIRVLKFRGNVPYGRRKDRNKSVGEVNPDVRVKLCGMTETYTKVTIRIVDRLFLIRYSSYL